MPGLSNDPEKRRRQLDGLKAGRRALALRVLADDDAAAEKPATSHTTAPSSAPPEPAREPSSPPASAGGLGVPVHTYGPPPKPPASEVPPPPAVPVAEAEPDYETVTPRRGVLGRLVEGLRDGT